MIRRSLVLAAVVGLAVSAWPMRGEEAKPAKKVDPLTRVLERLREPVDASFFNRNLTIGEMIAEFEKRYGLPLWLGSDVAGLNQEDIGEFALKPPGAKQPLGHTLRSMLAQRNLTYLVRKDGLELVPIETAARETKTPLDESSPSPRLSMSLVSGVFIEKPLNEALASLGDDHDVTIILAPQAGDAKAGFVSGRLLNVPLDQALELLALQVDLRVVPRGNAFLITTRDHANQLMAEAIEKERQKLELQRLRDGVETAPPAVPTGCGIPLPPAK